MKGEYQIFGRLLAGLGGAVAGVWGGAKLGAGVGIATGDWGMAATIPFAAVGGVIGFLGLREKNCK